LYKVILTKKCSNDLLKQKKSGVLSNDDLILVRTWISEMTNFGPEYIESCGHWNDHKLIGDRAGQRSSSFSSSGRIIYKIKNNKIEISVVKITTDHNYN
jgi:mRNA-degrading endonuclease YafQ of YafQ-DinJ toxin-antitoxin module